MPNTASPSSPTWLKLPSKKLPIIVVPGIMGSRLAEPTTHKLIWNPMPIRSPGGYLPSVGTSRLRDLSPLSPDEWNTSDFAPDNTERAKLIKHFFGAVTDFYDLLCYALAEDLVLRLLHTDYAPAVYVAGYDWRQDNAYSAQTYLAPVVEEALHDCGNEKVILIAHSMGGLVSRSYCQRGGEANVRALILLGSPSLGAVQPYARLKRGVNSDDDKETRGLCCLMGIETPDQSRDFLRLLPSLYQLMANRVQCEANPGWLQVDETQTGVAPTTELGSIYERVGHYDDQGDDEEGDPGFTLPPNMTGKFHDASPGYNIYRDIFAGILERAENRSLFSMYIDWAEAFHETLTVGDKAYMPDPTYCIACIDLMETPVGASLAKYGEVSVQGDQNEYVPSDDCWWGCAPLALVRGPGDSQVNMLSGFPEANIVRPFADHAFISGVAHGSLPNDPGVIAKVLDWIVSIAEADTQP